MKSFFKLILIFLILTSNPLYSNAQVWNSTPCNSMMDYEEACEIKVGKLTFKIFDEGKLTYQSESGEIDITINLPDGFSFVTLRSYEIRNAIIYFNIEIDDFLSGSSQLFAVKLSEDKLLWQSEIPAFNSSELLLSKDAIYVGGIGYVAKIDRHTGKKLWHIDSLYERETQAYNGFKKPFLNGETVVFPEDKVGKYAGIRLVVVDIESGQLISK